LTCFVTNNFSASFFNDPLYTPIPNIAFKGKVSGRKDRQNRVKNLPNHFLLNPTLLYPIRGYGAMAGKHAVRRRQFPQANNFIRVKI
jgi:hypothetical protein